MGRLPGMTLCGARRSASSSARPSATSSARASVRACARASAPRSARGRWRARRPGDPPTRAWLSTATMRSDGHDAPSPGAAAGSRRAGRCCPGPPQTTGQVSNPMAPPARVTRLPLLSISSCWRWAGSRRSAPVVGQHGVRRGAEEVRVPDAEQTQAARAGCRASGRRPEVLVHRVRARRAAPRRRPCRGATASDRPIGRPQRVAPADPVPEDEHVRPGRCRSSTTRSRASRRRRSGARRRPRPRAPRRASARAAARVGQRLLGGEGLRRDDEERASPGSRSRRTPSSCDARRGWTRSAPCRSGAPRRRRARWRPSPGRDRTRRCRCSRRRGSAPR